MTRATTPFRIPLPLIDAAIAALAALIAFSVRLDPPLAFGPYRFLTLAFATLASILTPAVFHAFGIYPVYWPYAGRPEVLRTTAAAFASTIAAALPILPMAFYPATLPIPRSVFALFFVVLLSGIAVSRMIEVHRLRTKPSAHPDPEPTLTAGQRPRTGAA